MPATIDGIVFIAQLHGIGATATDNLIQAINSAGPLQLGNSLVQVTASLIPGPPGVVANAIALGMTGVGVTENGVTTVGDVMGMAGSVAGMLAPIAVAAGVPLLATALTVTAVALAVGGLVYTINGIVDKNRPVNPDVNSEWQVAVTPPRRDPLAIDLDGDGIETVGIPASGHPILFDHNADGAKTGTGWLRPDDAWLVLDRDGNGTIDSGRELFGADTLITVTERLPGANEATTFTRAATSGFEALRTLDTGNGTAGSAGFGDGVFDAQDAEFTNVKLWRDLNQDGVSQSDELITLASQSITSINLTSTTTTTNLGNGNTVTGQATVTRSNGSTTQIDSVNLTASNLNLADNGFYREFTDTIALTEQAEVSAGMVGSGWVRDLRDAMSLGTTSAEDLAALVAQFSSVTTRGEQRAVLDDLIEGWAKTTGRFDERSLRAVQSSVIAQTSTSTTYQATTADPAFYDTMDPTARIAGIRINLTGAQFYNRVQVGQAFENVLNDAGAEIFRRIGVLEVFNGGRFVNFTSIDSVGGGGGSTGGVSGGGGGGGGSVTSTAPGVYGEPFPTWYEPERGPYFQREMSLKRPN